jgi:hypothetical protein
MKVTANKLVSVDIHLENFEATDVAKAYHSLQKGIKQWGISYNDKLDIYALLELGKSIEEKLHDIGEAAFEIEEPDEMEEVGK